MENTFEKNTFSKRLKSMLKVDARRLFISPFFYIMVGIALVVPILILVMTSMMSNVPSTNPQTGQEVVMHGFDYVWQILGSVSSTPTEQTGMSMDLVSMCNINMTYFAIAVLVCVFVASDFRSGYAKNLFTIRAKKTDYVISKTIVCSIGGGAMILAFFLGSIIGGAIASPLDAGIIHIILCLVGSVGFAVGMGAISNLILKKTSLV